MAFDAIVDIIHTRHKYINKDDLINRKEQLGAIK